MGAIYFHGEDNQVGMGNIGEDGSFTATDVPVGERDHFLQSVAAHLTGAPTDDAVIAAINAALDAAAVAWRA